TASLFLHSTFFAGLVYVGQTHLQATGRHDRREFLRKRLEPEAIAKAAFQRSAYASVFPMFADSAAEMVTGEPFFNSRMSELATNVWTGNASYDWIEKASSGVSGLAQAALSNNYDFSQRDWNNLYRTLPFQNMLGIQQFLHNLGGNLPKYSEDRY
ncbi:hypothetical protein H0A36_28730, partial [Endozoicomonas sp. SM1973]